MQVSSCKIPKIAFSCKKRKIFLWIRKLYVKLLVEKREKMTVFHVCPKILSYCEDVEMMLVCWTREKSEVCVQFLSLRYLDTFILSHFHS
jgi:hypothetical protein